MGIVDKEGDGNDSMHFTIKHEDFLFFCSLHPVLGIETQPWHLKVDLPKGKNTWEISTVGERGLVQ